MELTDTEKLLPKEMRVMDSGEGSFSANKISRFESFVSVASIHLVSIEEIG